MTTVQSHESFDRVDAFERSRRRRMNLAARVICGSDVGDWGRTAKLVPMPPYMKLTSGATIAALCELFVNPNGVAGFRHYGSTSESLAFNLVPRVGAASGCGCKRSATFMAEALLNRCTLIGSDNLGAPSPLRERPAQSYTACVSHRVSTRSGGVEMSREAHVSVCMAAAASAFL
jgi:hypothetical protein